MGHTHYNELANDGTTIFKATRSTGQIEEGSVGFSVAATDAGVVSWRFAPLAGDWPLVLVSRPADHRLITDPNALSPIVRDALTIHAKVWHGPRLRDVSADIDSGEPITLVSDPTDGSLWRAGHDVGGLSDGHHTLIVEARDNAGGMGRDIITFLVSRDGCYMPPPRQADGSDADAVGAWPEKGVLGTQLGPNRNGRKW